MPISYDGVNDIISTDITCTLDDIYAADQAGGWNKFHKLQNAFHCESKLHILSGGTLNTENEFCVFTKDAADTLYVKSGGELRMGKLHATYGIPCHGSVFKFIGAQSGHTFYNQGTFKFYDSKLMFKAPFSSNLPVQIYGTADIKRSRIDGTTCNSQFVHLSGTNVEVDGLEIYSGRPALSVGAGPSVAWNDIYLASHSNAIAILQASGQTVTVYNIEIDDCRTYIIESWHCIGYLVNPTLDISKLIFDTAVADEYIYIQYTFDPLVCEKDETPINGALVKMEEKIGEGSWNTLWEKFTGTDGHLADGPQAITYFDSHENVGSQHYHRITITKNGYAQYGPVEITIDHKIQDDLIVLDALTYSYDDVMSALKTLKAMVVAFA